MSKFTSGEWVYDEFSAIVKTVSNNSRPICIVIEDSENDYNEEEDANGRLIAAAPEMYSLICILLRCDVLSDNLPNSCGYHALTKARSIIDKVTGLNHDWHSQG